MDPRNRTIAQSSIPANQEIFFQAPSAPYAGFLWCCARRRWDGAWRRWDGAWRTVASCAPTGRGFGSAMAAWFGGLTSRSRKSSKWRKSKVLKYSSARPPRPAPIITPPHLGQTRRDADCRGDRRALQDESDFSDLFVRPHALRTHPKRRRHRRHFQRASETPARPSQPRDFSDRLTINQSMNRFTHSCGVFEWGIPVERADFSSAWTNGPGP